jgi:hypothetical protein
VELVPPLLPKGSLGNEGFAGVPLPHWEESVFGGTFLAPED